MRQFQRNLFRTQFYVRRNGLKFRRYLADLVIVPPWYGDDDLVDAVAANENKQIIDITLEGISGYFPR
jgi:hypothetical protein